MMLVVAVIVALFAFVFGVIMGLLWGPMLLSKKYQEMFIAYQKQLQDELVRVRQVQEQITQEYQKKIKQDLDNYLMMTAEPLPNKEEMN